MNIILFKHAAVVIHIECGLLSTAIKDSFNNLIITYLLSDVAIILSETNT